MSQHRGKKKEKVTLCGSGTAHPRRYFWGCDCACMWSALISPRRRAIFPNAHQHDFFLNLNIH